MHRSPEQVVEAAVQEDVEVLGVSLLSGVHMPIFTRIFDILADLPRHPATVAGGVMPDEDEQELKDMGVAEVLGQATVPEAIVDKNRDLAADRVSQS